MAITEDNIVRVLLRYRISLLALIQAIVRDDDLAEDVLQDVGALAVVKRAEIDNEGHLIGWMRKTARYRALFAARQSARQPVAMDDAMLDRFEAAMDRMGGEDSDRVEALRYCIAKLNPDTRKLIDLRYGQSIKGEALAKALGKKPNTVFVALSRAHQRLGECIRQRQARENR